MALRPDVELRPFQVEAVERMVGRRSLLLAMVMGAGKTPTALAAIEELVEQGDVHRCVIFTPATLKYQWQAEIAKFTTSPSLVIDGTPTQRAVLWGVHQHYRYVIANYEALINKLDKEFLAELDVDAVIADEATAFKSFTSKRSRAIKRFSRDISVRFGLTGQPVENRPEDLFSVMEYVDKGVLGHFELFDRTFIVRDYYGKPTRDRNLPVLHKRMAEAMYRKTREDIADQLPRVVETTIPVKLSMAEAKLYNTIATRLLLKLSEVTAKYGGGFNRIAHYGREDNTNEAMQARGEVMSMLLALRLVCVDPQLLLESAQNFNAKNGKGSQFAAALLAEGVIGEGKMPKSSKLDEVREYVNAVLDGDDDSKLVTFSTFVGVGYELQRTVDSTKSVIFNGTMNARQKDAAKQSFKLDPEVRLFLSSDVGGYGVDIPEANYLLSVDLPWAAGKYEQRESRIIRLSSEWEHVNIVAFVVMGSVEERIRDMLSEKKGVADAFIDAHDDVKGRYELTLSSLSEFLATATV